MPIFKRVFLTLAIVAASAGCDQATKHWANQELVNKPTQSFLGDTFRLTYALNDGAFLSLGANLPANARFWILTVAVGAMLVGILGYALWGENLNAAHVSGYALILSGGASNWVDRALNDGKVVDFMNMGIGSLRTGIFNVADLASLAGIGVLVFDGWAQDSRQKQLAAATAGRAPVESTRS